MEDLSTPSEGGPSEEAIQEWIDRVKALAPEDILDLYRELEAEFSAAGYRQGSEADRRCDLLARALDSLPALDLERAIHTYSLLASSDNEYERNAIAVRIGYLLQHDNSERAVGMLHSLMHDSSLKVCQETFDSLFELAQTEDRPILSWQQVVEMVASYANRRSRGAVANHRRDI